MRTAWDDLSADQKIERLRVVVNLQHRRIAYLEQRLIGDEPPVTDHAPVFGAPWF